MKLFVAIAILRHTAPCWCKNIDMGTGFTPEDADDFDTEEFDGMSDVLVSCVMNNIEDSYVKELCDLGLVEVMGEDDQKWIRRTKLGELTLRYYTDASRGKIPSFQWDNFYLELSKVHPLEEACSKDCSKCKSFCKKKTPFDWLTKTTYRNSNCGTTKESVAKQKEEFLNKIKEFTKDNNLDKLNILDNILNTADGDIKGFFVFGSGSDDPDFDDEE